MARPAYVSVHMHAGRGIDCVGDHMVLGGNMQVLVWKEGGITQVPSQAAYSRMCMNMAVPSWLGLHLVS